MANISVVYAKDFASVTSSDGSAVSVIKGTHWPADDPLVRQHPDLFTSDPRYGLYWSGPPPAYMSLPPDQPMTADRQQHGMEEATAVPGQRRTVRRND